jgi:hypothetical protein
MDVKYFKPEAGLLKKASKIKSTKRAPMQIPCYECHKPHTAGKIKPAAADCLRCHANTVNVGKHKVHLDMSMKCKDCHKPHEWKVTEAAAKKDCVTCHEYKSPKAFL